MRPGGGVRPRQGGPGWVLRFPGSTLSNPAPPCSSRPEGVLPWGGHVPLRDLPGGADCGRGRGQAADSWALSRRGQQQHLLRWVSEAHLLAGCVPGQFPSPGSALGSPPRPSAPLLPAAVTRKASWTVPKATWSRAPGRRPGPPRPGQHLHPFPRDRPAASSISAEYADIFCQFK